MKIFWFFQGNEGLFDGAATKEAVSGSRRLLFLILLSLSAFIAWAFWAEIDQITRAPGSVIASSKTQLIQSQEGGVLNQLNVSEGDFVKAGDVVVRLERTQAETSFLEAKAQKSAIMASIVRLRSEIFESPLSFNSTLVEEYPAFVGNQKALYEKRRSALVEETGALETMADLIKEELRLNRPLMRAGDVSRTDVLRLERQLAEMNAQITNVRNEFFRDAQAELGDLEEELAGVDQQVKQRLDRLEQTLLHAPVNGIVKNISITTVGGVIRPGEEIMQIVPVEDALVVEAKVTPADIAFVRKGLPATIKIDAYDYTIYGDLEGKLTYISADTLQEQTNSEQDPFYRIRVETEGRRFNSSLGRELEILPGMTAMVEIQTGKNTVLSYIVKPLVKTLSESLGER